MKTIKWLLTTASIAGLAACTTTAQAPQTSGLAPQDLNAMTSAAQLIQFDLAECEVLGAGGVTPSVAAISQKICADASAYKGQLDSLAAANSVTLPNDLRYDLKVKVVALRYHASPNVSAQYLSDEIDSHKTALLILKDETANGASPSVKAFATQATPLVQGNLNALEAASP